MHVHFIAVFDRLLVNSILMYMALYQFTSPPNDMQLLLLESIIC